MLVLHRKEERWEDRLFRELPEFLDTGDCLVLNESKVFPSRLSGFRSSGTAPVEVFLIKPLTPDTRTWQALVRPGRKLPVGERIRFSDSLCCEILARAEHGERTVRFCGEADVFEALEQYGHMPLPPYIRRADSPGDRERYNTVYAAENGSVAAPTAGLHFTPGVLAACAHAGAAIARVTLHVGLGTFAPLHAGTLDEVKLHAERYSVDAKEIATIRSARRRIAVGTTTARTLETIYGGGDLTGETDLFLQPGSGFHAVDAMLTNFHLPQSSLLILISAFAGRDFTLAAYNHAVTERYRFYSYGDCMLIL